jgi:hypothetical protein
MRGRVQDDIVKPDDVSFVFSELSMVVIVRPDVVWLNVPVSRRVGMVRVGLVHVLGRQRGKGDVRCHYQADDGPAEGTRHAGVIIGVGGTRRQPELRQSNDQTEETTVSRERNIGYDRLRWMSTPPNLC